MMKSKSSHRGFQTPLRGGRMPSPRYCKGKRVQGVVGPDLTLVADLSGPTATAIRDHLDCAHGARHLRRQAEDTPIDPTVTTGICVPSSGNVGGVLRSRDILLMWVIVQLVQRQHQGSKMAKLARVRQVQKKQRSKWIGRVSGRRDGSGFIGAPAPADSAGSPSPVTWARHARPGPRCSSSAPG